MRSALIVTSVRHCTSAQETLRVQDTVAALRRNGFKKSGFFVQFAGPAIFVLFVAADYIAQMLFH